MNATSPSINAADLHAVLRDARQCSALISTICDTYDGTPVQSREIELLELAWDLASGVYLTLMSTPTTKSAAADQSAAVGAAGKLQATISAACDAGTRYATEGRQGSRGDRVDQMGWLQTAAHDLAAKLVDSLANFANERTAA